MNGQKKGGTGSYQQVIKEIQKGIIKPVYLLFGEEVFLIDNLIEQISAAFLQKIEKEINFFLRYAPDTPIDAIFQLLTGGGLFSAQKVIVYKDFQNVRAPQIEKLKAYINQPNPDICLILVARTDRLTKTALNKLASQVAAINIPTLRQDDLIPFLQSEFQKRGKQIQVEACQLIIEYVGEQLHDILGQIEIISNYYAEKTVITEHDVENIVSTFASQSAFELNKQVAGKNLFTALRLLHNLLERGESPQAILALLQRHFFILWKIHGLLKSGIRSEADIRQKLHIYPRHYQEYRQQLRNWSPEQIQQVLLLLKQIDKELKSAQSPPQLVLDIFITQIINLN